MSVELSVGRTLPELATGFPGPIPNAVYPTAGQGLVLGADGTLPSSLVNPSRGTTFPALPVDGQEYHYVADSASGIVWRFKYNSGSASTYKWEFVGGPPMMAEVATAETTASLTYAALATAGPSITTPRAGDYIVEIGAMIDSGATGAAAIGYMSYDIGGTGALDADSIQFRFDINATDQASGNAARSAKKTALAASTALVSKYRRTGQTVQFTNRYMKITPIRVI